MQSPTASQIESLGRLLNVASGDSGQPRRVADFLLSWWNADTCGRWDLRDFWALDDTICEDILEVMQLIHESSSYPDSLGFGPAFQELVRVWRPEVGRPQSDARQPGW